MLLPGLVVCMMPLHQTYRILHLLCFSPSTISLHNPKLAHSQYFCPCLAQEGLFSPPRKRFPSIITTFPICPQHHQSTPSSNHFNVPHLPHPNPNDPPRSPPRPPLPDPPNPHGHVRRPPLQLPLPPPPPPPNRPLHPHNRGIRLLHRVPGLYRHARHPPGPIFP